MYNFEFGMSTKIAFGVGQVSKLRDVVPKYGKKILLVYGGGSVKKNGAYDDVIKVIKSFDGEIYELGNVSPNPHVSTARDGVDICKTEGIEAVIAIGGGSVIDCSKLIAAGAKYSGDCWELVKNSILIQEALPVFVVSTVAASGSDIDCAGVIMNDETMEKEVFAAEACSPIFTVLDPTYTKTVPAKYTAAGIADMMMHILEDYCYRAGENELSNRMMEAVLKTMISNGKIVMAEPDNYEARANLMWAASLATSGMLNFGRGTTECGGSASIHWMEGQVCGFYNTTHGEVLAQIFPVWMEYILCDKNVKQFSEFAMNLFDVPESDDLMEVAKQGIAEVKKFFFETLKIPEKMSERGVTEEHLRECAKRASVYKLVGGNVLLSEDDIYNILIEAL